MVKQADYTRDSQAWLSHIKQQRPISPLLIQCIEFVNRETPTSLTKCIMLAEMILSLELDNDTLITAFIYPCYQQHKALRDKINEWLPENCKKLIRDLLKMQTLGALQELETRDQQQSENLRKMLLAMTKDIRVIFILLTERLWMLRNASTLTAAEQVKLAKQTLDIYAPLANRLGIWPLKWEMEDLSLRYTQPEVYNHIAKGLAERRETRENYIKTMTQELMLLLHKQIKNVQVTGRVKHIYSIYKKMHRKHVSLNEIYDAGALRVLVNSVDDCYTVLSILQSKWDFIEGEFDDYIANPKPNGYQSIHAVIVDKEKRVLEIQIRTKEMHQASELGIAAHWLYKENSPHHANYQSKIALLRQIMAWQKEITQSSSHDMQDLFADRIYVFTPLGDIIDLPQNATPLDFAYHIHSEVGHRCRGAKVNQNIVPLTYTLQTGDRVEILTGKEAKPSRDWLNPHLAYLKTSRARAKAQHWFKLNDHDYNVNHGREILERELKRLRIHDKPNLDGIAEKLNYKSSDALLAGLGIGEASITVILNQIQKHAPPPLTLTIGKESPHTIYSPIKILGVNNLLTQFARCCKPLPGDQIIGYITRDKGVSVHRHHCPNVLHAAKKHENRLINVNWSDRIKQNHPADLILQAHNRNGLLRDITGLLANEKINIIGLRTQAGQSQDETIIHLTIEMQDIDALQHIIEHLKQVQDVIAVTRH